MIFYNNIRRLNLIQIIVGFFVLFAFLYIGFYVASWILYLLGFLAPALLIAAAFLNFSTLKNFIKYLWGLIRVKPLWGLALVFLAVVGFPVTCTLLFVRAWSQWRKRKNYREAATADGSEYINYEVVDDDTGKKSIVDLLEDRN